AKGGPEVGPRRDVDGAALAHDGERAAVFVDARVGHLAQVHALLQLPPEALRRDALDASIPGVPDGADEVPRHDAQRSGVAGAPGADVEVAPPTSPDATGLGESEPGGDPGLTRGLRVTHVGLRGTGSDACRRDLQRVAHEVRQRLLRPRLQARAELLGRHPWTRRVAHAVTLRCRWHRW